MRVSYVTSSGGSRGLTSRKFHFITRLWGVKHARRLKPRDQAAKGATAMADLGLLLGAQLRKRLAKRLVEKNRVVAEAVRAAPRVENQAARFVFEDLLARRPDQRRRADEARGAAIGGGPLSPPPRRSPCASRRAPRRPG